MQVVQIKQCGGTRFGESGLCLPIPGNTQIWRHSHHRRGDSIASLKQCVDHTAVVVTDRRKTGVRQVAYTVNDFTGIAQQALQVQFSGLIFAINHRGDTTDSRLASPGITRSRKI